MITLFLSPNNYEKSKILSQELISINGWKDQYTVTSKVFSQFAAVLGDLSLGKCNDYTLRKEMADAIFVTMHIINKEKIKENELYEIGFHGYSIHGEKKIGKVARTYQRVLGINDYKPTKDFQTELQLMAKRVLAKKISELGQCEGTKYQLGITIEETTEISKELSKRKRGTDNREEIVEEAYDILYTFLYPKIIKNISKKELNQFITFQLPQIRAREITYKKK